MSEKSLELPLRMLPDVNPEVSLMNVYWIYCWNIQSRRFRENTISRAGRVKCKWRCQSSRYVDYYQKYLACPGRNGYFKPLLVNASRLAARRRGRRFTVTRINWRNHEKRVKFFEELKPRVILHYDPAARRRSRALTTGNYVYAVDKMNRANDRHKIISQRGNGAFHSRPVCRSCARAC